MTRTELSLSPGSRWRRPPLAAFTDRSTVHLTALDVLGAISVRNDGPDFPMCLAVSVSRFASNRPEPAARPRTRPRQRSVAADLRDGTTIPPACSPGELQF